MARQSRARLGLQENRVHFQSENGSPFRFGRFTFELRMTTMTIRLTAGCLCAILASNRERRDVEQEEYLPKRGSESRGRLGARYQRRQRMGLGVAQPNGRAVGCAGVATVIRAEGIGCHASRASIPYLLRVRLAQGKFPAITAGFFAFSTRAGLTRVVPRVLGLPSLGTGAFSVE